MLCGVSLKLCEGTVKCQRGHHATFIAITQCNRSDAGARPLDKRQSESAALQPVLARQGIKALKNTLQRIIRDTTSAIGHREQDLRLRFIRGQCNNPPGGVKSMALSSKLPRACSSSSGSPATHREVLWIVSVIFFAVRTAERASAAGK